MIPHSFNPRSPHDTDCPPYFYNGGFEPRWPLYRVFADYTTRLSLMLTGGRHVCPVALLYLGGSVHAGKHILPDDMSEALQDALYDCDWLPYEVFEKDTVVDGPKLQLRDESYRVLVMPAAEVIPHAVLVKAKEFFDSGGVVVGYGVMPARSATLGKSAADIRALAESLWGKSEPGLKVCKTSPAGGRTYFLPSKPTPAQLQQVLAGDAQVHATLEVLEGDTGNWLHVLHRVRSGRDIFFIANQNHLGPARTFRMRVTAPGEPECWDAMRNEITALPYARHNNQVELTLTLHPNESTLLIFQDVKRSLPLRDREAGIVAQKVIPLVRQPLAVAPEPQLRDESPFQKAFEGHSWIWYPEGNPSQSAAPGACYFRKKINLPGQAELARAEFLGTADNSFNLYINGVEAGMSDQSSEGWRNPVKLDVRTRLRPGLNQLAIQAINTTDKPSPAGLLGCLHIELSDGSAKNIPVDGTWRVSRDKENGWSETDFDDSRWQPAMETASYGSGPWSRVGAGQLTLSPAKANPFLGICELPDELSKLKNICLVMEGLAPEAAARVTVNGKDAGGFIGLPFRLPVSAYLKPGLNQVRIEPFAPASAQLVFGP